MKIRVLCFYPLGAFLQATCIGHAFFDKIKLLSKNGMKHSLLFLIACIFSSGLMSQIDSYAVKASKTYENKTKTVYLNLNADLDAETAKTIELAMEANSDIHKFSFYARPDFQTCMFTANLGVHEDEIIALMNEVVFEAKPSSAYQTEFARQGMQGDYYKAVFELDRKPDDDVIKAIHLSLKESDFITDVNYRGNARFEIFAFEPMYPEQVNQMLERWNVKVSEEDIK